MDSIDYYDQNASTYYDKTIDVDMTKIMKPFIELLPENAEVLDLGCGSGRDTLTLDEAGFSVTPLDGSKEMCRLAEIYTDKDILHLTFDEIDFQEVFDGIWACASLVHTPHKKMPELLDRLVTALVPGGIFYFSVREGDRNGWDGTREFYDYSEDRLRDLLSSVKGVKIVDVWTTDALVDDENRSQWFNILLQKED
ncbi:MAG: class I SAM-dependent methyltransferase [Lachnospiraceae bacterium]|nr:class I SAM-dependent methyltransferase [Lachnospiraceae bacterium]